MNRDAFKEFVLDQLQLLERVDCRAMFGGYGLYHDGAFFGIIHRGQLFFKTTGATRADYEQRGMAAFRPSSKQTLKNYYEVPTEIVEDAEQLTSWAQKAIAGAAASVEATQSRKRRANA